MGPMRQWLLVLGALVTPLELTLAGGGALAAQEPTTEAGQRDVTAMPAAVHAGYCGEGGDLAVEPVYELGVLGPAVGENDEAVTEPEDVRGTMLSPPVLKLEEEIDTAFDDLLGRPHAIVIHQSAEDDGTYAACGELGGVPIDGELAVGLRPLSEERYYGVAVLEKDSGAPVVGEDTTRVTVYLFQEQGPPGPLGLGSTPEATPNG